jgi:ribonucleoside-diphosphate reductase alpha chain
VRALDEVIDYQHYPVLAAEHSTVNRRSLGIGYIGLAHFLAKNKVKYDDEGAHELVHRLSEHFQFNLIKASVELAKEKGPCGYISQTKYHQGLLPIDHYKKDVDDIVSTPLECDWESLREEVIKYGVRNSTLSAQMPSESSSVVSNETNGIEPPRDYLSIKKSKKGPLKQIVPGYPHLKNFYTLLWEQPNNDGYIKIVAIMQKFFDQAISGNWSYNPENYDNNEVPLSEMAKDMLNTYKYGWKTSYYQNTYDSKTDEDIEADTEKEVVDIVANDSYEDFEQDEEDCEACNI